MPRRLVLACVIAASCFKARHAEQCGENSCPQGSEDKVTLLQVPQAAAYAHEDLGIKNPVALGIPGVFPNVEINGGTKDRPNTATGIVSHYDDGCLQLCSVGNYRGGNVFTYVDGTVQTFSTGLKSCDLDGNIFEGIQRNVCEATGYNPELGTTCPNMLPWMEDGILYAFAAGPGVSTEICGACAELVIAAMSDEYGYPGPNEVKAIVQFTNGGVPFSGNLDLQIPAGGPGTFNGMAIRYGKEHFRENFWYQGNRGDNWVPYGGIKNQSQCEEALAGHQGAIEACRDILFDRNLFNYWPLQSYAGNGAVVAYKPVPCPRKLMQKGMMANEI